MNNPWLNMKAHHTSLAILRVDPIHPLDWHWAVHQSGQYMILCENVLFSEEVKLPQLKGIHGMYKQLPNKISHGTLFFILKDNNNWELFLALCLDIIQATMRPQLKDQHATIIGHRLLKWQDFLKKERSNNLTEFQIIGLLGELFFLKNHLALSFGWNGVVSLWVGPLGHAQDFSVGDINVEVKTQLSTTRSEIYIASADQLSVQGNDLYLYVATVSKAINGDSLTYNLPSLINAIKQELEPYSDQLELFNARLWSLGYVALACYESYNYVFIQETMYKVVADFPRITVDSLMHGITKVNYAINLSICSPYKATPPWIRSLKQ